MEYPLAPHIDMTGELDGASGASDVASSAHNAFREHHEEIQRRRKFQDGATSTGANQMTFDRKPDQGEVPFRDESQRFFVWSASHVRMPPIAVDAHKPALRIYGAFATESDARAHARLVHGLDPRCSVLVSRTHDWIVLPKDEDRVQNAAESEAHVGSLLAKYHAQRTAAMQEVQENVREQRAGICPAPDAPTESTDEAKSASTTQLTDGVSRIGRDAELRDQSVVAISFVNDETFDGRKDEVPEPLFRVYRAFENTSIADEWARCAGDHVIDFNIDIVSTCEWLFPSAADSRHIKDVYRSEELGKLINHQKTQPEQCDNFRRWRDEALSTEA
jgi:hypothetical protein